MRTIWDVKSRQWNTKHVNFGVLLCQATWGGIGLGFDSHYSKNPVTNRYDKSFWISLKLLWADVMFHADWGRKAWHDQVIRRARELTPVTER